LKQQVRGTREDGALRAAAGDRRGGDIRTGDIVSGGVLAGLGVYIVIEARSLEYMGSDGPGPGFFPMWYGACMIALSLILAGTGVRGAGGEAGSAVNWREIGRVLASWAAFAACVGLLPVLGFLLAFGAFTFLLIAGMYRRPVAMALTVAVLMSAGFYLLFPLALNVELPVGRLGF
jgi:putative tricarboxylic transport membrane protein